MFAREKKQSIISGITSIQQASQVTGKSHRSELNLANVKPDLDDTEPSFRHLGPVKFFGAEWRFKTEQDQHNRLCCFTFVQETSFFSCFVNLRLIL